MRKRERQMNGLLQSNKPFFALILVLLVSLIDFSHLCNATTNRNHYFNQIATSTASAALGRLHQKKPHYHQLDSSDSMELKPTSRPIHAAVEELGAVGERSVQSISISTLFLETSDRRAGEEGIFESVSGKVKELFGKAKEKLGTAINGVAGKVQGAFESLKGKALAGLEGLKNLKNRIVDGAGQLINKVKENVNSLADKLSSGMQRAAKFFSSKIKEMPIFGKKLDTGFLKSFFSNPIEAVKEASKKVLGGNIQNRPIDLNELPETLTVEPNTQVLTEEEKRGPDGSYEEQANLLVSEDLRG